MAVFTLKAEQSRLKNPAKIVHFNHSDDLGPAHERAVEVPAVEGGSVDDAAAKAALENEGGSVDDAAAKAALENEGGAST